jgi:hypothetical protein
MTAAHEAGGVAGPRERCWGAMLLPAIVKWKVNYSQKGHVIVEPVGDS